ncbi:hypothetical protein [Acinetobacter modestus]|uniref:hypothetical protein n=1 Tax=Acinetobacter modestus TaxID=1776740 RepID=UPI001F4B14EC|nr:hypothetical protein [Acinetobacter modestus]MCH7331339.1 hypothetical protein [Acinetobacter modestus]
MKDINFSDTVQFGIWKYLDEVNGVVVPQYSCAQPITNGVRLGNGNDTIAGVGECGVTPPLISCDGATNTIVFADNPDFTAWLSIDSITINGVEYVKPEGLPSGDLVPESITPSGDQIRISIGGVHPNRTLVFENVGTRSARISIKVLSGIEYSPNIIEQGLSSTNTNPTAIFDSDNYVINFCLSHEI